MTVEQFERFQKAVNEINDALSKYEPQDDDSIAQKQTIVNFNNNNTSAINVFLKEYPGEAPADRGSAENNFGTNFAMMLSATEKLLESGYFEDVKPLAEVISKKAKEFEDVFRSNQMFNICYDRFKKSLEKSKNGTLFEMDEEPEEMSPEEANRIDTSNLKDYKNIFTDKDKATLTQTGSPEYSAIRDTLDESYSDRDRLMASWEYLRRKNVTPWFPEGKRRVESAARLMATSVLRMVCTTKQPDEDQYSELWSPDAVKAVKAEICRNDTFRKILMEELPKCVSEYPNGYGKYALEFYNAASLVDANCRENGDICTMRGKLEDDVPGMQRFNDAVATADKCIQNANYAITLKAGSIDTQNYYGSCMNIIKHQYDIRLKNIAPAEKAPQKTAPENERSNSIDINSINI